MGKSNKIMLRKTLYFYFSKDSMEKFNQLARRFSMRKDTTTTNIGKYSRQPM
jgi:hypothetical protein